MKKFVVILLLIFFAGNAFSELPTPAFNLAFPGETNVIDYSKYGEFQNIGTENYTFIINDKEGLAEAVGEGIYPNTQSVKQDILYEKLKEEGRLNGSHWTHVGTGDYIADFFVWATAPEEPGVKLFFTAETLREAGLIIHAIKAYYAVLVHFPASACFSRDSSFVWYVGPAAIEKIDLLCRKYPELGIRLQDALVKVENGKDIDLTNDIVTVNPGKFVKLKKGEKVAIDLEKLKIVEQRGKGKVKLIKYENGHWQMIVDDKPFIVKGITYGPSKIGESPHNGTSRNWMFVDDNKNGKIDAPYESWVDKNKNNKKDKNEKIIGDFQLLKEMGCNTIRHYYVSSGSKYSKDGSNKEILRDLFNTYGIRVIMGDFLGAYTIGSGADWNKGTDYNDKAQCERMKNIVKEMVLDHKDEPYILMWLLGNENNMDSDYTGINTSRTLASKQPEAYAKFLNEVAKMIHEIDENHPVAVGNMELYLIDYYEKYAQEIDILGINSYRGKDGFGSLWKQAKNLFDRPVLITEYGCDAFNSNLNSEDEESQEKYHKGCWEDIRYNLAGESGKGNALGGVIFEWLDEWWKSLKGSASSQQKTKDCPMDFPDGWSSEEWLGIVRQGNGKHSPFLRQLRKSYFLYEELWNEK